MGGQLITFVILIGLGYFVGRTVEARHFALIRSREKLNAATDFEQMLRSRKRGGRSMLQQGFNLLGPIDAAAGLELARLEIGD